MIKALLDDLKNNPKSLKISGKNLLYNIDLRAKIGVDGKNLQFLTQGSIRVGPLKSSGFIKTEYLVEESSFEITSVNVDFPKINFKESYIRENEKLLFTNKKLTKNPVDESFGPSYDPQPLLFKMALLEPEEDFQYSDRLLLGGKTRPYHFISESKKFSMSLEGKELFRGFIASPIDIEIPKFKVKVNIVLD